MAILKCAEMQKTFGCGSVHQLRTISARDARAIPFVWPWLRRRGNCPERARDEEVRELRLALTPLKPVEKSTKNPRRYRCPSCGGRKALGARQCRRCWRVSVKRQVESG
ncbi:MAG TPA: hypothetical protein VNL14_18250 [Candidatus Acidoferrales bacterium]|nr:hypothetical protein [Candidatus Acidoferrales bacterium]